VRSVAKKSFVRTGVALKDGILRPAITRIKNMADKLGGGDTFPSVSINLLSGEKHELSGPSDASYRVILFYRAHW
jgi:hypothetical protein